MSTEEKSSPDVVLRCACEKVEITCKPEAYKFSGFCHCTQCRRTSGAPYWHGVGYFTTYSVGKDGKAFFDPQGLPGVAVTKGKDHLVEYALGKIEDWRIAGALIDWKGPGGSALRPEGGAHIFVSSCTLRGLPRDGRGQFTDAGTEAGTHPWADGSLDMGDEKNRTKGEDFSIFCACREVQIDAKKEGFLFCAYCHCTQCRRTTSSPYWQGAGYKVDACTIVKGKDSLVPYKINRDNRWSCRKCHSTLYHEATDGKNVTDWRLSVSLAENASAQAWKGGNDQGGKWEAGNPHNVRPDALFHINTSTCTLAEGIPNDGLPQFEGMPGASEPSNYPIAAKKASLT